MNLFRALLSAAADSSECSSADGESSNPSYSRDQAPDEQLSWAELPEDFARHLVCYLVANTPYARLGAYRAVSRDWKRRTEEAVHSLRPVQAPQGTFLASFPALTSLDLSHSWTSLGDDYIALVGESLSGQKLQKLNLTRCEWLGDRGLHAIATLTNLTDLILTKCSSLSSRGVANSLRMLTRLTALKLSYCPALHDDALDGVAGLTNLVDLRMRMLPHISEQGLRQLVGLTKLTYLDLGHCHGLEDSAMQWLVPFSNLEGLNLSGTGVRETGMRWVTKLPRLKSLSMVGSVDMTTVMVADITQLTSLNLRASDLSIEGVHALRSLTKLAELDLSSVRNFAPYWVDSLRLLPSLTRLNLGSVASDWVLFELCQVAENGELRGLTALDVNLGAQVTDSGIAALAAFVELKELSLADCRQVSDSGLMSLAAPRSDHPPPALTRLDVSGANGVGALALSSFKGLRELSVRTSCADITLASLHRLEDLERLDISHSSSVTGFGLMNLLQCKNLKHVKMSDCGLSKTEIEQLQRTANFEVEYDRIPKHNIQ